MNLFNDLINHWLNTANDILLEENVKLKAENKELDDTITNIESEHVDIVDRIKHDHIFEYNKLYKKNNELAKENEKLKAEIEALKQNNNEQRQEIVDLHQLVQIRHELVPRGQHHPLPEEKQCRFKVGDRVMAYRKNWFGRDAAKTKGTVEAVAGDTLSIKNESGTLIISGIPIKDCKKLVRKKPKFKVDDQVNYYHFTKCVKATVVKTCDIDQDSGFIKLMTHKDDFMFYASVNDCKRLIRKKLEFKVGDRVMTSQGKGTITAVDNDHPYPTVSAHLDNGSGISTKIYLVKKLKKKRPEFKVGDRVKGVLSKGTVTATINDRTKVVQVKFDYGETLIVSQESIRKLKRKAKKCPGSSGYEAGDTLYFDDLNTLIAAVNGGPIKCKECSNGTKIVHRHSLSPSFASAFTEELCQTCEGTGWFHWNNDIP